MTETSTPLAPSSPGPPARRPVRPLSGFGPIFAWGLAYVVRWRKVLVVAVAAVGVGLLIGYHVGDAGVSARRLATAFDEALLKFGLPLVALLLVAEGFAYEVQSSTLVYHLARPVSRTTVFLARFFAGLLPAIAVGLLLLGSVVIASRVEVAPAVWLSLPVTVTTAMLALGAVYYALAAMFRRGLVVGLVYTFVVETLVTSLPGSMQKLSVMFHVRSLHHRLTEGLLPVVTKQAQGDSLLTGAASAIVDDTVKVALVTLLGITVVALTVGAWTVSRKDFPLR